MSNRDKLWQMVERLSEELAGEVLDFAEFLEAKRAGQAFGDWERDCPEEEVSPELAVRLDAARAEAGTIPAEEVYRQAGLSWAGASPSSRLRPRRSANWSQPSSSAFRRRSTSWWPR